MQTRASTRSSVLGKRHADCSPQCDVATEDGNSQLYSPLTPEASPNPKRIKTSQSEVDDGSNKENIPPLKGQVITSSPSRTRSLRRTNTEASISSTRSTPRRHASMSNLNGNPRTPATALLHMTLITPPSTPSSLQSVSAKARALLRPTSNSSSAIAGREKERDEIRSFLLPFLQDSEAADGRYPVLYISGSPGTGKTALVNEVLCTLTTELADASAAVVPINCMALANVDALFATLVERLQLQNGKSKTNKAVGVNRDTSRQTLERLLRERNSKCLLFLDELDHIGSSTQALAELFSLIDSHSSFIRLIGIANTHTLTSSSSNTLSALTTEHVKTLHFQPYTSAQLLSILNTRLEPLFKSEVIAKSEDPKKFLPPPMLNLLSKKIASQTGDVRALFEVLRGAIDIAINAGSSALDAPTPPVTPAHVLDALKAYAPAAKVSRAVAQSEPNVKAVDNETTMKIRNLGLQSRVVLLALLLASKRLAHGLPLLGPVSSLSTPRTPSKRSARSTSASTTMDVSQLHTYYSAIVSRSEGGLFTPVSRSEFGDLMGMLETVGLVTLMSRAGGKSPTTPGKSGRKLQRSMSSSFNLGSGGSQEVGLSDSVRMEEVVRGLGINEEKVGEGEDDVREEEVKAIWKKEQAKIMKEAKVVAAKVSATAEMFAEAIED